MNIHWLWILSISFRSPVLCPKGSRYEWPERRGAKCFIMLSTDKSNFDRDSCGTRGVKLIMHVANNQCIPVINTLAWTAIVSCVCKLILLLPVVFHLVVAVHVFNSGIVICWTANKRQRVESGKCSYRDVFDGTCISLQGLMWRQGPSLHCCGQSCSPQSRTIVKISVWKLAEWPNGQFWNLTAAESK